ncbi:molybdenum cofactor guanylyltransferase [Ferviditalea candida]|uniref:Probable molybdenum cofactor guanylyltransferase n=1 Tax=Ferviditalea candida TaxID=3108399 RepID=A0ABU5ZJH2_9BACL|nr:molybdenum cofactor guanylyltransferase [Paenibacillaceae bacterium T2]
MSVMNQWCSVILSGGRSSRMGSSKALLSINGMTMIERLTSLADGLPGETIIISNPSDEQKIKALCGDRAEVVLDEPSFQGEGPLAGMLTAMTRCKADWYMVLSNDMPYIDHAFLNGLKHHVESHQPFADFEAYVPEQDGRIHPFPGVYRDQASRIEELLRRKRKSIRSLLDNIRSSLIPEQVWNRWSAAADPFFNMNTPEDLKVFRQKGEHRGGA